MDDTEILASLFKRLLQGSVLYEDNRLTLPGGHYIWLGSDLERDAVQRAQADVQRGMARREARRAGGA